MGSNVRPGRTLDLRGSINLGRPRVLVASAARALALRNGRPRAGRAGRTCLGFLYATGASLRGMGHLPPDSDRP
eukprot:8323057-Lingulodinium_polyedra.AAC.1